MVATTTLLWILLAVVGASVLKAEKYYERIILRDENKPEHWNTKHSFQESSTHLTTPNDVFDNDDSDYVNSNSLEDPDSFSNDVEDDDVDNTNDVDEDNNPGTSTVTDHGTCFKRRLSSKETPESIEAVSLQKRWYERDSWNKRTHIYKLMNMPECTEISLRRIRRLIKEAADAWNSVEGADVRLVRFDDPILSNSADVKIDIEISFQPCRHKNLTTLKNDEDFDKCEITFGHASYPQYGPNHIHLNTNMIWSDKAYGHIPPGSYNKPNLYTIVLHEMGHALGLRHSNLPSSIMYWDFTKDRAYKRLKIDSESENKLREIYPIIKYCIDRYDKCSVTLGDCNDADIRAFCRETCRDCTECVDEYIKCNRDICNSDSKYKVYCQKTCNTCTPYKPDGCGAYDFLNGKVYPLKSEYDDNEKVIVICNKGYELTNNSKSMRCMNGKWEFVPTCEASEVTTPPPINCKDISRNCAKILSKKRRNCKQARMKLRCAATCQLC